MLNDLLSSGWGNVIVLASLVVTLLVGIGIAAIIASWVKEKE